MTRWRPWSPPPAHPLSRTPCARKRVPTRFRAQAVKKRGRAGTAPGGRPGAAPWPPPPSWGAAADMSFLWPGVLILLLGVPLVVVGYVRLLRRRSERAAALAAQGFVPNASARRLRKVRHLPPVLFLVAVVVLLVAFARPEVSVGLPHREGTVILAFDVSNSMLAKDLQPTRMDAAKAAAKQFVDAQPGEIKIGIVAFNNGALITQQPTTTRADTLSAIDRLSPTGATSLGQGIFTALSAIAGRPL